MMVMEKELNITAEYLQRADVAWGSLLPNGSFTGMIKSVMLKEADIIATSLTMRPERFYGVNFLMPMGTETQALLVKRTSNIEKLDWTTYFKPFSNESWHVLSILALFSVLIIKISQALFSRKSYLKSIKLYQHIEDLFMHYWLFLCSYFGKPPPVFHGDNKTSFRLIIFILFFTGNVIFLIYRASLTSELSKRSHKQPFDSLDDLLNLDFR